MYIEFVSFSRLTRKRKGDLQTTNSNRKMETIAVLFSFSFFFSHSVVGESLFRLLSLYLAFRFLLFVKKETDRSVVLFEQSRQNNWKVKISITKAFYIYRYLQIIESELPNLILVKSEGISYQL